MPGMRNFSGAPQWGHVLARTKVPPPQSGHSPPVTPKDIASRDDVSMNPGRRSNRPKL
jgi:hypothetical protein